MLNFRQINLDELNPPRKLYWYRHLERSTDLIWNKTKMEKIY